MKHFITYILVAVLATLCSKGEIPTPPEPPTPVEPVTPEKTAPKIIMDIDKNDCILAESYPEVFYKFHLENSEWGTKVEIVEAKGVNASAALSSSSTGTIRVKANQYFNDDSFLVLRASNEDKFDEVRIDFEKAYAKILSVGEGFAYDESKQELTCDMKALSGVVVELEANVDIDLVYPYAKVDDWFDAVIKKEDGHSRLELSVTMNFSENTERKILFTITNSAHTAELLPITVRQAKDADRFTKERNALIALYKSLNGDNWRRAHGMTNQAGVNAAVDYWCTDMPLFRWYGVTLNPEGHVRRVSLDKFGIEGTIPEEIGDLVYCEELDLAGTWNGMQWAKDEGRERYVSGTLPESMANMKSLRILWIMSQHLEGDLESSPLKTLVQEGSLEEFALASNNFTGGCPEWIADMEYKWCYPHQHYTGIFEIHGNRLSGKVPERVKNHTYWNHIFTGVGEYQGKTMGYFNMVQQEGYGLWE